MPPKKGGGKKQTVSQEEYDKVVEESKKAVDKERERLAEEQRERAELQKLCDTLTSEAAAAKKEKERRAEEERRRQQEEEEVRFRRDADRRREQREDNTRLGEQYRIIMRQEDALRDARAETARLDSEVSRLRGCAEVTEREAQREVILRLARELRSARAKEVAVDCRYDELSGLLASCSWQIPTPRRAVVIGVGAYQSPDIPSPPHAAVDAAGVAELLQSCGFVVDLLLTEDKQMWSHDRSDAARHRPCRDGAPSGPSAREPTRRNVLRTLAQAGVAQQREEQLLVWVSAHCVRHARHGLLLMPSDATLPTGAAPRGFAAPRKGQAVDCDIRPEHNLVSLGEVVAAVTAYAAVPRVAVCVDATAPRLAEDRAVGGCVAVMGTGVEPYAGELVPPTATPLREGSTGAPRQPSGLLYHAFRAYARRGAGPAEAPAVKGPKTVAGLAAELAQRRFQQGALCRWPCDAIDAARLLPAAAVWPATAPHPAAELCGSGYGGAGVTPARPVRICLLPPSGTESGDSLLRLPPPFLPAASSEGHGTHVAGAPLPSPSDEEAVVLVTLHLAVDHRLAPLASGHAERVPVAVRRRRATLKEWSESFFAEAIRARLPAERRATAAPRPTFVGGGGPLLITGARLGPLAHLPSAPAAGSVEVLLRRPAGARAAPPTAGDAAAALRELLAVSPPPDPRPVGPPPRYLVWAYAEERTDGEAALVVTYAPRPSLVDAATPGDLERAAALPPADALMLPGAADGVVEVAGCPAERLRAAFEAAAECALGAARWPAVGFWQGTGVEMAMPESAAELLDAAARATGGRVGLPPPVPRPPEYEPPAADLDREAFSNWCALRRERGQEPPPIADERPLQAGPFDPSPGPFAVTVRVEGSDEGAGELPRCGPPARSDRPRTAKSDTNSERGVLTPLRDDSLTFNVAKDEHEQQGVVIMVEICEGSDPELIGVAQTLVEPSELNDMRVLTLPLVPKDPDVAPATGPRQSQVTLLVEAVLLACERRCFEVRVASAGVLRPVIPPRPPPLPWFADGHPVDVQRGEATVRGVVVSRAADHRGTDAESYSVALAGAEGDAVQAAWGELQSPGTGTEWELWAALAHYDAERQLCERRALERLRAQKREEESRQPPEPRVLHGHEVELRGVRREEWARSLNLTPPTEVRRLVAAVEVTVVFVSPRGEEPAADLAAAAAGRFLAKGYIMASKYRALASRGPMAFFTYRSPVSSVRMYPPREEDTALPEARDFGLGDHCRGVELHIGEATQPCVIACDRLSKRNYILRAGAAVFRNGGVFPTDLVRQFLDAVRQGVLDGLGTPTFEPPGSLAGVAVGLL